MECPQVWTATLKPELPTTNMAFYRQDLLGVGVRSEPPLPIARSPIADSCERPVVIAEEMIGVAMYELVRHPRELPWSLCVIVRQGAPC